MSTIDPTHSREVVVVRRWKRFGHDRAYVEVNGAAVGYRDLTSGEIVCDDKKYTATISEVTAALADKARAMRYEPKHATTELIEVGDSGIQTARLVDRLPTLLPDIDLADNEPGHAIRIQARALRDAAPIHTALARMFRVHTDERAFRIGAEAEVEVARRLAKLGPAWRVLHSIPVGDRGSDIDHLVIGPAGVFTINTKNHPTAKVWVRGDTFTVNGQHHFYVRNSRHEAARAAKLLSARTSLDIQVTGVIAVMGATGGFTVKEQPSDGKVAVVRRKEGAAYLTNLPQRLDASSVEQIYAAARHLSTWQPTIVGWSDF